MAGFCFARMDPRTNQSHGWPDFALRGWTRAPIKAMDGRFCFARMDLRKKSSTQKPPRPALGGPRSRIFR
jgi:hypothetical protein